MRAAAVGLAVVLCAVRASAQPVNALGSGSSDEERTIVFEIGGAADWSRSEGLHSGGTFAFEVTPIEGRLELEIGVTAIRSGSGMELPVDVLFKKPWPISRAFEFMLGAGPEVIRATGSSAATYWGLEGVADLMFWPRRRVGWYVEPGYEMTVRAGDRHQGVEIAGGLLLGR